METNSAFFILQNYSLFFSNLTLISDLILISESFVLYKVDVSGKINSITTDMCQFMKVDNSVSTL